MFRNNKSLIGVFLLITSLVLLSHGFWVVSTSSSHSTLYSSMSFLENKLIKNIQIHKLKNNSIEKKTTIKTSKDLLDFPFKTIETVIIIEYPHLDFGLLCNVIHQVAVGIDFTMSYPVENPNTILFLAFETKVGNNLISALDIAHLRHFSSILSTLDYEYFGLNQFQLNNVYFVFDWEKSFQKLALQKQFKLVKVKPSRFQRVEAGSFSFSLTFCLRPARELQNQANPIIARFKQNNLNKRIISVHRRHFGWCTPEYKHYRPFCGDKERNKGSNSFYFNDCNVTYSDQLLQFINSEWTGQQKFQRNDFVFFLATDLHDLGGDQTFYDSGVEILKIPHAENPEHVIHNELSKERRMNPNNHTKGFLKDIVLERTGVDMAWDLSMLVDMHAQTKSDLSLGAPYSSCDRILSMWRSLFGQATLISFEKYGTETNAKTIEDFVENSRDSREYYHTLPSKCYKYFENPEDGTSSVSKYRKWWQEKGVPMLATKNKLFTLTTSETAVTEIVT